MGTSSAGWTALHPVDEMESVSAGMILRSVSTAVGTEDKVTVDNFARWLVNDRPMYWGGWLDTSAAPCRSWSGADRCSMAIGTFAGSDELAAEDVIVDGVYSHRVMIAVKTRQDRS